LGILKRVQNDGVGGRDDGKRMAPEGRAWCRDDGKGNEDENRVPK
jgi:hypothetical protein